MRMNPLGRSGLTVSRMCFGTLTMSPLQQNMTPEAGARLLVYAYERGVRFLDTADLYGTYPHIRLALRDAPDYVPERIDLLVHPEIAFIEVFRRYVRRLVDNVRRVVKGQIVC